MDQNEEETEAAVHDENDELAGGPADGADLLDDHPEPDSRATPEEPPSDEPAPPDYGPASAAAPGSSMTPDAPPSDEPAPRASEPAAATAPGSSLTPDAPPSDEPAPPASEPAAATAPGSASGGGSAHAAPRTPAPRRPEVIASKSRPAPAAPPKPPSRAPAPGGAAARTRLTISPVGVTLIKEFEGFPFGGKPYRDVVGVWTIGYGHTHGVTSKSKPLTLAQATELLRRDLDEEYAPAVTALRLPLTQHQFDALVSFVYNCGPGAISSSTTIGRLLRAHNWRAAADALLAWDKAGGRPLAGLTRRRRAERALFLTADDPYDPYDGYPPSERQMLREYDRLVRLKKDPKRCTELQRLMAAQRGKIYRAAQPKAKGGDGHGWNYRHRRARYASLRARTR